LRGRATQFVDPSTKEVLVKQNEWGQYKIRIVSENNFPTAAGLASSASGYCCLVFTLSQLFGVKGEISTVARMGSGSACRSMYGGWVKWNMGELEDGSDSKAVQVTDELHWPEMQILVLVVNDQKKDTSSTDGMQQSVKTSKLMQTRKTDIVPKRMVDIEEAILKKNFPLFGELTMRDSDSFHDVCADTIPPIYYLKPISKDIIHLINCYNKYTGNVNAAYTFDAGPNAVIYLLQDHVVPILALSLHYFPPAKTPLASFFKNNSILKQAQEWKIPSDLHAMIGLNVAPDALKYILNTRPGPGPQVLPPSASLVDPNTALPLKLKQ
jgi:diphosphomevalonate decarboxylase